MQLSNRGNILSSVTYYIRWYRVMNIRFLKSQCAQVFMFFSKTLFLGFFSRNIVTNREWCGSLKYYTNCRQTWAIDNFFSHTLLHYCPKQNSFSYDSYHIRNMLAILDHNNHVGRTVRVREDGEPYAQAQVSRRTKQWVAYEKKCPKEYKYIPGKIDFDCPLKKLYNLSSML